MKPTSYYTFIIVAFGILLASCEGSTERYWDVENNSALTIQVTAFKSYDTIATFESINSGQRVTIGNTYQLGGNSYPQSPDAVFTSILITNENGDTSTKDFSLAENWETSITQLKKTPSLYEHIYILHISDDDF